MSAALIVCDIHPLHRGEGDELAKIVATCARDLDQPLVIKFAEASPCGDGAVLTLHLPATQAASQHPVWCLACQLACFCPDARVSVLVPGALDAAPANAERAQSA